MVGYSPWGRKESDTTKWLHFHFHFAFFKSLKVELNLANSPSLGIVSKPLSWLCWLQFHGFSLSLFFHNDSTIRDQSKFFSFHVYLLQVCTQRTKKWPQNSLHPLDQLWERIGLWSYDELSFLPCPDHKPCTHVKLKKILGQISRCFQYETFGLCKNTNANMLIS